jgi:hypothetical protein
MDAIPVSVNAANVETLPLWAQIMGAVFSTAVTAFLLPWLRHMADAAKARATLARIDTSRSILDQKRVLVERLKSYLIGTAAAVAEEKFPRLCEKIQTGQFKTSADVKAELYSWGDELRNNAVEYFGNQGIDIVAAVGEKGLDMLITRAANAVSPFPGKETSVELLKDKVVPMLVDRGTEWARKWYAGVLPQHEVDSLPAHLDPSVGPSIFSTRTETGNDTTPNPTITVH